MVPLVSPRSYTNAASLIQSKSAASQHFSPAFLAFASQLFLANSLTTIYGAAHMESAARASVVGEIDEVNGRPLSIFSNRLVLTDQSLVDPEKLDKVGVSRSLRGRDLSGAVLNRADLRKADFTGALNE
jgi:uncharacterized protein YjbI with pentapeptide repeats